MDNEKTAEEAAEETEREDESSASKWSFVQLKSYFEEKDLDYDALFRRINDLCIKTLIAVEPAICGEWSRALEDEEAVWGARGPAGAHPASCFEIYGFDVLID